MALLGRTAPTGRLAALTSAVFFAVLSVTYYGYAAAVLATLGVDLLYRLLPG